MPRRVSSLLFLSFLSMHQWKDGDAWHAWHARACRDAPLPRKCGGVDEEKRTEACMVKYLQFSFYSGPKRDLKN